MRCQRIQKRFSAYLDGELESARKRVVEMHLRECEACRAALERLVESWDLLDVLPEPEPVPYFYTRLKARMTSEEREKKVRWTERVLVQVSTVAVVALGVFVGSTVGKNGNGYAMESSTEEVVASSLYLDSFDDFPSASLGEAYLDLVEEE